MEPEPLMKSGVTKPRLLLVEDDPVSRHFLCTAAEGLPAQVDAVDTIAAAIALAADHTHDLWLFDANLPDGSGIELLQRLRDTDWETPALAHTASRDRAELDGLIAAGFSDVLVKPLTAIAWQSAIRRALGAMVDTSSIESRHCGKLPLWDEDAALAALNGNREHVVALRYLFLAELPAQRDAVLAALRQQEHAAVRDMLHRLKASCGFVGALRLLAAVNTLDAAPCDPLHASLFYDAVEDTLAARD